MLWKKHVWVKGPTLIEAVSYRLGDHTTADDADVIVQKQSWRLLGKMNLIARLRTYLEAENLWDQNQEDALLASAQEEVDAAVKTYMEQPKQPASAMFDFSLSRLAAIDSPSASAGAIAEEGSVIMAEMTLLEAVNLALHHEMEQDPETVVLGEDIGTNGGVFRATVGLREKFGVNALLILLWLKLSLLA